MNRSPDDPIFSVPDQRISVISGKVFSSLYGLTIPTILAILAIPGAIYETYPNDRREFDVAACRTNLPLYRQYGRMGSIFDCMDSSYEVEQRTGPLPR